VQNGTFSQVNWFLIITKIICIRKKMFSHHSYFHTRTHIEQLGVPFVLLSLWVTQLCSLHFSSQHSGLVEVVIRTYCQQVSNDILVASAKHFPPLTYWILLQSMVIVFISPLEYKLTTSSTRVWTQGLVLVRQTLYTWAMPASPKLHLYTNNTQLENEFYQKKQYHL
jgi:hypothetical protein